MASTSILEHSRRTYVGNEASFGAGPAAIIAATDAVRHHGVDIASPAARRVPNMEITATRGNKKATRGRFDAFPFKGSFVLAGSGNPATPPDFGPFLKASGFTETIGATVVYSRTDAPTTSAWFAAVNRDGSRGVFLAGLIIQKILIPDIGTKNHTIDFEGIAARASEAYATVVGTGGIDAVALSLPLAVKNGWVHKGANFAIEVDDGVNTERMLVTAVDQTVTPPVATVTRAYGGGAASAFVAGSTIRIYSAGATVSAENPIAENGGSFSIDDGSGAFTQKFTKAGIEIATGLELDDPPGLDSYISGFYCTRYGEEGARITTDWMYRAGDDGVAWLHDKRERAVDIDLALTIGNVAGNRLVVDADTCEVVDVQAPRIPDGQARGTVVFGPYNASTGADIQLTFS